MSGLAKGGQIVLEPGQVAVCVHCHDIAECGFVDTDEKCIECGVGGLVVKTVMARGKKSIAARWGEDVAACGFTAAPNVLVEHWAALGVTPIDQRLLELLELHRREKPDAWPSEARLAELANASEGHVRKRLHALRKAGLIEWTRERRGGRFEVNVYTRAGLTAVADRIAKNRRAGVDDLDGLDDLRADLRHRASERAGTTAPQCAVVDETTTAPPGSSPPRLQEQTTAPTGAPKQRKETETDEPDSSSEASSLRDHGDHEDLDDPFPVEEEPETVEGTVVEPELTANDRKYL